MKIEVKDKNEKVLSNGQYILEALGFKELYEKLESIDGWSDEALIKVIVMFAKDHPQQIDVRTWKVYLVDNIILYLKRGYNGHWYAEVMLPFEYRDDLTFFLRRMERLLQRVKEVEQAIEELKGKINALDDALNNLIEEKEDKKKKTTSERLADVLEKLVSHLEEIEE